MIKYFIIDVDGTMTDGGIYYDSFGNELKKFCTKDAAGFFVAREIGIQCVVLTGRQCVATERRMQELKASFVFQNIINKNDFLKGFMQKQKIYKDEICYIGDDINDIPAMKLVRFIACPADASIDVKNIADYVSPIRGGYGAVRDIIEHYLRMYGYWDKVLNQLYGIDL